LKQSYFKKVQSDQTGEGGRRVVREGGREIKIRKTEKEKLRIRKPKFFSPDLL
jgi:hypothetical protein